MKIATVLGTRPEIIRLSLIIKKLDGLCDHVLIHTGQNFDERLSALFFEEMGVRDPDYYLGVQASSAGGQIGQILEKCEEIFLKEKPDRILILGDTNSGLSAIIAKRLGIPVFHMEAGNRCFDDRVPEETNRRLIDSVSDILMPYTHRSKENLYKEGYPVNRVYVTGNPIYEVLEAFSDQIEVSTVLQDLSVAAQGYFLATIHRAENVDDPARLSEIVQALVNLHGTYGHPVIVSTHPKTRQRLEGLDIDIPEGVRFMEPLGFFDFVHLEKQAFCVLSDSGTVQEECAIFSVPNVTVRDVTERPETFDCGSNMLSGADTAMIERAVQVALGSEGNWNPPLEYLDANVSDTVARLLLSYHHLLAA